MKKFGDFKPSDKVVSSGSLTNLHLKINSLSDLDTYPDQTVAVCMKKMGDFEQGDVIVKRNGFWLKLLNQLKPMSSVTQLRGYKLGNKAYIRWHEPPAVTNRDGVVQLDWVETVIVRKYGAAPSSINDGLVVFTSTKRDRFHQPESPAFIDPVADADGDKHYFYRAFVRASNGYVAASAALELQEMTWSNICQQIRKGNARSILDIGDVFVMEDNDGRTVELVVASIDTMKAPDKQRTNHPHLVTFLFRYAYSSIPFDYNKGMYQITRDTYVQPSKKYYMKEVSGSYRQVTYLMVGEQINEELYEVVSETRGNNGSNYWSASDIRAWANLMDITKIPKVLQPWMAHTGLTDIPMNYLRSMDKELADAITQTDVSTFRSYADDMKVIQTSDYFFIPSVTEIFGTDVAGFKEGTQFELYANGLAESFEFSYLQEDGRDIFMKSGWWTRSTPHVEHLDTGIELQTINEDGELVNLKANNNCGCILAFSVG